MIRSVLLYAIIVSLTFGAAAGIACYATTTGPDPSVLPMPNDNNVIDINAMRADGGR